uniref:Uncharacterized protein n=1 Tax=Avena sativa TaxID=4498 RepID=A0ACD5VNU5_AVESA
MAAACQSLQEREELRPYDGCGPTVYGGHGQVLLPRQASTVPPAGQPEMSSSSTGSGRSAREARALKIHSEAERRRRERINAHLATLRRMIPDTMQMDKAALLARVVDQVKRLKRTASEATELTPPAPPETDEVSVECFTGDGDDSGMYIMASVSCDDRPDLVAGLIRALHGLRLRTVRAEVSSLGGRVRHVFMLCNEEGGGAGCVGLKEAVRQALAKVASPELMYGIGSSRGVPFQSKKQGIIESHCSIMSV